ncbi:MAG TPA: type II secretion system protein [Flavobacteriales bacterium]|nr:type II secretion system protein [Flavobacteriales bacterium]
MKLNRFTMIELLAVLTVTSILLVMTISSFKHSPVTSVQVQVGSAIEVAFNKHLVDKLESRVYIDGNQLKTLHTVVNLHGVNIKITMAGSEVREFTFDKFQVKDSAGYVLIEISDNKNQDDVVVVRVSGFTGHVSYYNID